MIRCCYSHLVLVLDKELDTLNGSGSGLSDRGRDTSHEEVGHEGLEVLGLLNVRHFDCWWGLATISAECG